MTLTTPLHLVLRLRMSGAVCTSTPPVCLCAVCSQDCTFYLLWPVFLHTLIKHPHPVLIVGYIGANTRIILNWLLKSMHVCVLR